MNEEDQYHPTHACDHMSYVKFHKFAMELIRYNVSSRQGAALANALLLDLEDYICSNQSIPALSLIFLDKSKVDRCVSKLQFQYTAN